MQEAVVPSQITDNEGADQSTYSGSRERGEIGLMDPNTLDGFESQFPNQVEAILDLSTGCCHAL